MYEPTKVEQSPIIMATMAHDAYPPPLVLLFLPIASFDEYFFIVKIDSRHPHIMPTVMTSNIVERAETSRDDELRLRPMLWPTFRSGAA